MFVYGDFVIFLSTNCDNPDKTLASLFLFSSLARLEKHFVVEVRKFIWF